MMKRITMNVFLVSIFLFSAVICNAQIPKVGKKLSGSKIKVPTAKDVKGKTEECYELFNEMSKKENTIYKLIDEGNTADCGTLLTQYKKMVVEYKEGYCPKAKMFEDRIPDLQAAVSKAYKDQKCNSAKADVDKYKERVENGFEIQSSSNVLVGMSFYKKSLNNYKSLGCIDDYSEYDAKITKWELALENAKIAKDPLSHFSKAMHAKDKAGMEAAFTNGLDIKKETAPLKIAIKSGDIEMVDFILEKGANINLADQNGSYPLDYTIGVHPDQAEIDMKKHLISKGADLKLAGSNFLASRTAEVGDFAFFKEIEAVHELDIDNYLDCYWRSPKGSEISKHCAEKIKAGTVGKSWASVKEGQKDASLSSKMLTRVNDVLVAEESGYKFKKVKITSPDWGITRHVLTGIILYRYLNAVGYGIDENGVCYTKKITFKEYYDGNKYGSMLVGGVSSGYSIIDCD